ncbi:MAG: Hvo_1808 family surface protein [Haloferacaceae archaeon]
MNRTAPLALALLVVLSGCAGLSVSPPIDRGSASADRVGAVEAPADLADPPTDTLGWEGGYWYDEPLSITPGDGLNQTERDAVVSRTMARVEYLRGLEFTADVPVTVTSREEFRQRASNRSIPAARRQFDNVKFEALFLINESTDSVAVQNTNTGSSVAGYYTPANDQIVIVGDGAAGFLLKEQTLAHELTHALQDQHFDLTRYDRETREGHNALSGLIEGDASYVGHLYRDRCGDAWDCLQAPAGGAGGSGGGLANIGPYLLTYQPYSDGPTFVRQLYRRGGWSAVNDAYDAPPESTEQVIHPARYPADGPARPTVTDRTRGSWARIPLENRPDYDAFGEAGTNVMLVFPGYDSGGATQIVPLRHFLNTENGQLSRFDPLNYDHYYTEGIRGDRLVPYRDADNRTGYVWKLVFDDRTEATEFRRGYERLLAYHNATAVDSSSGTTVYRIPEGDRNGFSDAFRVTQRGDTIVITNAPTVGALKEVRAQPAG